MVREIEDTCSSTSVMNSTITAEAIKSGFDLAIALLNAVAVRKD
jgi:hypothetical protein